MLAWWAGWPLAAEKKLKYKMNSEFSKVDPPRTLSGKSNATGYNNFYEFSLDKTDVAENAKNWKIDSWKLEVTGHVKKPRTLTLADLTSAFDLEERIYRFRCVEAWSLVVPWIGIPLADVIKRVEPTSKARFVEFYTLHDVGQFPQQRTNALEWP